MKVSKSNDKQRITVSLTRRVLRKAKILAARQKTSISGFLSKQIELLVSNEDTYERSRRQALALMNRGFHLGSAIRAKRAELHKR